MYVLLIGVAMMFACGGFLAWYLSPRRRFHDGLRDDFAKLNEATEAFKVEVGTALLPAFRKMEQAALKLSRDR